MWPSEHFRNFQNILRTLGAVWKSIVAPRLTAAAKDKDLGVSSGKVGRLERSRVFFSHLGSVWKMKLEDAATLSGYSLADSEKDKKISFGFFYRAMKMK